MDILNQLVTCIVLIIAMLQHLYVAPCTSFLTSSFIYMHSGVKHMYVHVVHDNGAAQRLYSSLGYEKEAEETEGFARALRRPRRLLLHKQL